MKKICLLLIGIIILSACTFSGLDTIRDAIPNFVRTPTSTYTPTPTETPTPTWTPSPTPTPTPVPHLFDVGQSIFLIPELVDAVFGPFDLGRSIQYIGVLDLYCRYIDTYELSREWVYHGQEGLIVDFITCGEDIIYKVAVEDWTYAHTDYLWIRENQLSEELPLLNYPYVLSFSSDSTDSIEYSPYTAYLPEELVVRTGQAGSTTINGQPVQITLIEVLELPKGERNIFKFYRFYSTVFMIQNEGTEPVEFNTRDLIKARINAMNVFKNPTVKLAHNDSTDVKVLPGETANFGIVWSSARTMVSDQLAIYISVNTPIEDDLYVFVLENSLLFRAEILLID